jgi:DNA-binding transcriptional ArsR family regulator
MIYPMVNDIDETLAALAEPTRRSVVELLRERPRRAGELAELAGTTPPAMSRHLRVLRRSGLVAVDPTDDDARLRVYRLRPESLIPLQAWLDQVQAYWHEQLNSFKSHVETREGGDHD